MKSSTTFESSQDFINSFFSTQPRNEDIKDKRNAVRYIRDDITVFLKKLSLFGFNHSTQVSLYDISTSGALISAPKSINLDVGEKIQLTIEFSDDKTFEIKATAVHSKDVVHHTSILTKEFGLQFDQLNHDLGRYLQKTQPD